MSYRISTERPGRPEWLDEGGLKAIGSHLDPMGKKLFVGIAAGKAAEANPHDGLVVAGAILAGATPDAAKEVAVTAAVLKTKQGKEVIVADPDNVKIVMDQGGEFLREESVVRKL